MFFAGFTSFTPIAATGGTITEVGGYRYHTFTSSGTLSVSSLGTTTGSVEYLIVAGGGGGGAALRATVQRAGGGGGAGGYITGTTNVTATNYSFVIGAGGPGNVHAGANTTDDPNLHKGSNSTAFGLTAIGGGGGGSAGAGSGGAGGSGGGSGRNNGTIAAGTSGQGNNGGAGAVGGTTGIYGAGGGGGANGAGSSGTTSVGGNGGSFRTSLLVNHSGGGGGARRSGSAGSGGGAGAGNGATETNTGGSATVNTGSGGGGASVASTATTGTYRAGGTGGSGIVVVRYPIVESSTDIISDGLSIYLDATNSASYPGTGTTWFDLSGNGRDFTWNSVSYTAGSPSYFNTGSGRIASGPASDGVGINNTSGYTIFVVALQNSLTGSSAFKFYKGNFGETLSSSRGIFSHCTFSDGVIYFDQGGCCASDTRTNVSGGTTTTWNIYTFRRLTNSSTRSILKNGSVLATNTNTAATLDLDSRGIDIGGTAEDTAWNARLGGFIVYNRGLSDQEVSSVYDALRTRYGI